MLAGTVTQMLLVLNVGFLLILTNTETRLDTYHHPLLQGWQQIKLNLYLFLDIKPLSCIIRENHICFDSRHQSGVEIKYY